MQRRILVNRRTQPGQLRQERRHARRLGFTHTVGRALQKVHPRFLRFFAIEPSRQPAQHRGPQPIRRPRIHGIAATEQHLDRRWPSRRPPHKLMPQPRLAHPGWCHHQCHSRRGLLDAGTEHRRQRQQLLLATDTWSGLAEQLARLINGQPLTAQGIRPVIEPRHLEARIQQARRQLIKKHRVRPTAGRSLSQQQRRSIDRFAHRHIPVEHALAGRDRHHRFAPALVNVQRRPRRSPRQVRCRPRAKLMQRPQQRAIGQSFQQQPRRRKVGAQRLEPCLLNRIIGLGHRRQRRHLGDLADQQHAHQLLLALPNRRRHHRSLRARPLQRRQLRQAEQLGQHRATTLRPLGRVFAQHAGQQQLQRGRQLWTQRAQRRRLLEQDLGQDGGDMGSHKRRSARQTLMQHTAKREHIRSRAQLRLPARLLGRHVLGSAHDRAGLGHRRRAPAKATPRNPKVQQHHLPRIAIHQKQIRRLDVTVNSTPVAGRAGDRSLDRALPR
jgi:hypothetical protein